MHTNWVADLDPETTAVAAAAAAAAGLSAQLGRGHHHAVRLLKHNPAVLPLAAAVAAPHSGGDVAAQQQQQQHEAAMMMLVGHQDHRQVSDVSPMWLSLASRGQQLTAGQDVGSALPAVCSPACLLVSKKLWDSPPPGAGPN